MRDRHRPALGDLAPEDRDHAAGRPEDVPEADGDEARLDVLARAVGLDDPLAQRLRLAHHRLRVHGFVGRDEHEPPRAELDRRLGDDARAQRVVAYGFERIRLHQRHVLVRRGVEDHRRPVAVEDLVHLPAALAVREDRHTGGEPALVDELALDVEQRGLALLDKHEPLRPEASDLAA